MKKTILALIALTAVFSMNAISYHNTQVTVQRVNQIDAELVEIYKNVSLENSNNLICAKDNKLVAVKISGLSFKSTGFNGTLDSFENVDGNLVGTGKTTKGDRLEAVIGNNIALTVSGDKVLKYTDCIPQNAWDLTVERRQLTAKL